MAIAIEQSAYGTSTAVGHTSTAATFGSAIPAGRTLVAAIMIDGADALTHGAISTPSGWTRRDTTLQGHAIFTRVAGAAESLTVTISHNATDDSTMQVHQMPDGVVFDAISEDRTAPASPTVSIPAVTPDTGSDTLLVAFMSEQAPWNLNASPSGYTLLSNQGTFVIRQCSWTKAVDPASGSYSSTGPTFANTPTDSERVHISFIYAPELTADFSAVPRSGADPLSVAFTDESFGGATIDTWLWDFGDGSTSTSQNPTNIYEAPGSYTVSLTVTDTDDDTDSLTRTAYIVVTGDYVAPEPGGAILEIYTSLPGAPRWNVARWGQEVWNSAGWVDVTPQGITVQIRWGSHQPERGILLETEAATWLVTTYDPDRLLDPGNEDSPYHTDLVAGLPIRLRHRGTIIRQGYAERIAFFHADMQGAIRATDNVSLMARTPVPSDSVVADTLYARARDVISAAGLRITVAPDPPAGDPALAPRLDGDRSVWRHIADAAEQVLHIAYVDRIGTLHFRPWADPYDRGRGVDETNLVDLGTQIDAAGLFSVVQARDEITEDIVERRLTPTPKYGRVTYTRDELTPDAAGWTDAVLADRSLQTVQWIPGMIWPLTADDVEYFATLEAVEVFGVRHLATDPVVDITGIIVGGEINVKGKKDSAALWSFALELSQTATQPLIDDVDGENLMNEQDDAYLYAG